MLKTKKSILAISGSTKASSTSLSFLNFIKERYKDKLDLTIYNQIATLPHFNPELESELPKTVLELRNLIEKADGILFCTPEYVFSLPGSVKNLLDWQVSTMLFSDKPTGMIIAAASGLKAFESLDLILTTLQSTLPKESKLLIQGAKGKIDKNGDIADEQILEKLNKVITSLLSTIEDSDG